MRVFALIGLFLTLAACGVRAAPRPPHPDARPQTGDPNMVRTNSPPDTAPADTAPVINNPSYEGGLPPWQKPPTGSPETEKNAQPGETSPDEERDK